MNAILSLLLAASMHGHATLHNAFPAVLATYPDRVDHDVDGYIATADCDLMGDYFALYFEGQWWVVRQADCMNRALTPPDGWLVDISRNLWLRAHASMRPRDAALLPLPHVHNGAQARARLYQLQHQENTPQ